MSPRVDISDILNTYDETYKSIRLMKPIVKCNVMQIMTRSPNLCQQY